MPLTFCLCLAVVIPFAALHLSISNALLLGVTMLSALVIATHIPTTQFYLACSLTAMVVYLLLGALVSLLAGAEKAISIIVALAALQAAFALVAVYVSGHAFRSGDLSRIVGSFEGPTQLATMLACVTPLAFMHAMGRPTFLSILALTAIFFALIFTWSRGPIFAASLGCLAACLWTHPSNSAGTPKSRKVLLSTVALMPILLVLLVRSASASRADASYRAAMSRPIQWRAALDKAIENPLGVGPGNIQLSISRQTADGGTFTDVSQDPKNQVLANLLIFGVVAIPATAVFVYGLFRSASENVSQASTGIRGACVTLCALGIFDSPFYIPGHEVTCGLLGMVTGLVVLKK